MTLSLFMAGVAVFFVMSSVSSIEDEAKKKFGDDVTVLVAKNDIKEMDSILDGMIEPRVVPRRFVEPSAIAFNTLVKEDSHDYAMETKRIIGNVAIVPIKKGEQLSLNKITEPSMRTGLAPQVSPGKRAISVNVDETSGVAKLIKPGDRVDIIAVIDPGNAVGGRDNKVAKTLFQDIVVLAVGRNITNNLARKIELDAITGKAKVRSLTEFDGFSSVTLEVDPNQAQLLAAITTSNMNRLVFTLRNNDDTDRTNLMSVRAVDALSDGLRIPAGGR
ncbi:MAG: Flp pilus assembly protein CpaB [Bdellovibrionales bacterium]|nr:Flp pilus assembly protein CpaB [Bdellovibrionales bacterium]